MERASKNFITSLRKQKRVESLLFLDNVKIIKDSLAKGVIEPKYILTTLEKLDFDPKGAQVFRVDQKSLEQLSDTKTPQKVLCIAYYPQHIVEKPKTNFLVLDTLQDPGNVGTLIRTAKASGFESVFLLDCVRLNNPKLIRSSVGAVFDGSVFEMTKAEFVSFSKQNNLKLVCCDMNGENIFTYKPSGIIGVVVGNEGQGVSKEIEELCFKTLKIPMKAGIESLNAGVSGSIIMYEINKNKFID